MNCAALPGTNYTAISGSVTFAAGSDHTDVTVAPISDGTANPTLTGITSDINHYASTTAVNSTATQVLNRSSRDLR